MLIQKARTSYFRRWPDKAIRPASGCPKSCPADHGIARPTCNTWIQGHAADGQEGLDRNDLLIWAKRKWPDQINLGANQFADIHDTMRLLGTPSDEIYPVSIEGCRQLLRETRRKLQAKDIECVMLIGEGARHRVDAERYRQICETNQLSAKWPRKEDSSSDSGSGLTPWSGFNVSQI